MSSGTLQTDSFINRISGYIIYLQEQNVFSQERIQPLIRNFLMTVGFFVSLYFLIQIQIFIFWLLKLIFRPIFQIISIIFWLPLKTIRFLIPKTIDYDILFPLFWLCSISSFYISKFFHENICQFYDQYLVQRYKIFNYNQIKREDIRRYLFIITFIVLLLLQSLFILVPIAISIRHHHENSKISSTTPIIVTQTTTTTTTTTTIKPPTVKSAVKDVVKIMSRNLYNRFINAFKDENEITSNEKRPPLISDEKLEDTFKTIKNGINNIKSTDSEEKKSSRFQRWIIHYLKAPFQKWEPKTNDEQINPNIKEDEEENIDLSSSSESDEDDEDEDDDSSETDDDNIIKQISSKDDEDSDEDEEDDDKNFVTKLSSSIADDDEDSAGESDEDDEESTTDTIKEQIPETIETVQNLTKTVNNQLQDNLSSSTNQDDEESGNESDEIDDEEKISKLSEMIKETLADPIEKVKNVASDIKTKIISSTDKEDEESISITEQIKQHFAKPIETIKDFSENVVANVKDKLSSSKSIDEEDSKIESDKEEEEEKDSSILNRVKENVVKPIETAATNLHEKISSNVEKLKHKATNLVNSTEEFASNILKKSSGFVKEKNKKIKEVLPKPNKIKSKVKHEILEPLKTKASKVKKVLSTKSEHVKKAAVNKIKSLKQKKKPKTLTEKVKDKFHSLSKTLQEKQEKKKVKKKIQNKLNGLFDEAWNVWHQTKTNLEHIFTLSTKHARHLPRYNTTSLYTAYTDLKCYDYTKISNRYRLLKYKYMYFLDTYRHHSPFPVYLSILKSNGPKCYRHYPDSTCGLILKSSNRSFKVQLYRFVRFWALIGIIIVILGGIYKNLTTRKQTNSPSFHRYNEDFDRSSNKNQKQTTISNKNDLSKPTTTNQNQQTNLSNTNTRPLDNQIKKQLHLLLEHEQNDGFRNLSEICRIAINNTFLKQLERLSVETLQFANAKIHNVSQNNNKTGETSAEKIIINAKLDIDHLILNIVNTFKEQHFSLETQKLSGQLYILLGINPNQYSIEANLQQLQIHPVNIIDPNNVLSANEKQSIVKLLDETINRTIVRCSFRLSDNQENANPNTLYNSSPAPYPDTTKTYSSSNQLSTSSIQSTATRSRQATPNRYQPSEPLPTLLINDTHQHLYTDESSLEKEPKRLLIRIVKAVKLHDVEQPYCILELNHPKQIHQTSIAKNGLNPFWDERFLFECDDKSNQIHLQIIDRKKTNKRTGNNYVDTVYADVLIPFSYITSTVYKQDVQISPQYPESIIRIEFSTLSEEEALAANNGYDVESLTDSQTWTYNDRDANKIEHDHSQRYQQSSPNDFISTSYETGTLPKHYGLSASLYDDDRDYASTLPRSVGLHSYPTQFSPSNPLTPRDGGLGNDKPQKSKSFMSSLKHLTLPGRKHHNKDKRDNSVSSQASSSSQLNTSLQSPQANTVSHSLSTASPGPYPGEYFLSKSTDSRPIRRSRSISQSFKNLFRSNSKKKVNVAKADALGEFENVDNRNYLPTSTPTSKKLAFFHRRKSKQTAKQQTNVSTNSLSSYDCSRSSSIESVRDTPVRANVGHPVTMAKAFVR